VPLVVAAQEPADERLRCLAESALVRETLAQIASLQSADENMATALIDMLHDDIVEARAPQLKVFASTTADDIEAVVNGG
jgi:hypothetical protein